MYNIVGNEFKIYEKSFFLIKRRQHWSPLDVSMVEHLVNHLGNSQGRINQNVVVYTAAASLAKIMTGGGGSNQFNESYLRDTHPLDDVQFRA